MKLVTKITLFAMLVLFYDLAFATDTARDAAINSAFSAGNASVGTVIAGVLGLVALGTGMTLIIQWLRK